MAWIKSLLGGVLGGASGAILKGDGTWPFVAHIDGEDIVFTGLATAFGGANDSQDNGLTASGVSTKAHPDILGCALPMRDDHLSALRGSPIPRMPFLKPTVEVTFADGKNVTVPILDLGPGKQATKDKSRPHVIDLTVATAQKHDPKATANDFETLVSVRVLGGARYATAG